MRTRTRLARRLAIAAGLAATLGLTAVTAAPAQAATRPNDLRGFCAATVTTSCVSVMDNDEGILQIRDAYGHRHTFRSSVTALRYLHGHAVACKREDSPRCYWDAGHVGNHRGDSFITVGAASVFYLGGLD